MRLLFDTHMFIWWTSEPAKLSPRVLALCEDTANTLVLSVVSVWEIHIKSQLGKLTVTVPLEEVIEEQQRVNNVAVLPLDLKHVLALQTLPVQHKDPFDRMLIAQALVEDAVILSVDHAFANYPVRVLG